MDIFEALKLVKEGKKVTNEDWDDVNTHVFMSKDKLCIRIDGKPRQWLISQEDMDSKQWKVV